jgi:hypothetical protein
MTDTDELIKAIEALPSVNSSGLVYRPDVVAAIRRHTAGRPAVEGKPLELMTRDELLSYIRHSAKRDAVQVGDKEVIKHGLNCAEIFVIKHCDKLNAGAVLTAIKEGQAALTSHKEG